MRNELLLPGMHRLGRRYQEILLLRHQAELSNAEAAAVLKITPWSASKRYTNAIRALKLAEATSGGCFQPFANTGEPDHPPLEAVASP